MHGLDDGKEGFIRKPLPKFSPYPARYPLNDSFKGTQSGTSSGFGKQLSLEWQQHHLFLKMGHFRPLLVQ